MRHRNGLCYCAVQDGSDRSLIGGFVPVKKRDPETLAAKRDVRCRSSAEVISAALMGNYRDEHVFALTQALELYDIYQERIMVCDRRMEILLLLMSRGCAKPRIKTK